MIDFTEEQLRRYGRHVLLKEVGVEGQARLLASRVLIIGAGRLGSPAALYLADAGVPRLRKTSNHYGGASLEAGGVNNHRHRRSRLQEKPSFRLLKQN
jgi:alkyl hydroperoxide reductase subunit AhpF